MSCNCGNKKFYPIQNAEIMENPSVEDVVTAIQDGKYVGWVTLSRKGNPSLASVRCMVVEEIINVLRYINQDHDGFIVIFEDLVGEGGDKDDRE